jgi:O-antigen/teichoic acid export membrane protein
LGKNNGYDTKAYERNALIAMGKYRCLGKNTLLVFIGNMGAKVVGLLMLPFYTRWLSVEDYGTTDIINVYVSLLLGLVTACIAEAVFVFPKDQDVEKQKSYFSSGLFFAICSLSVTALLFKGIKNIFVYQSISNSFTTNTWFIYGLLVTNFLQQYIQQFVRSMDKMKVYSTTGIVVTVSTAICSFLVIPRYGVFGYVLALIFANFAGVVYSFWCSSAYRYFCISGIKKGVCKEMLKYSVPLIPNSIMWWLVGAMNRPLMEHHLGLHAIGIFAVANKFPGIVSVVFSIFSVSWQISVLEEFRKERFAHFFNTVFRIVVTGLFFIFFIIAFCGRLIVSILTTPAFYEASRYILSLTLGAILSSVSGLAGSNFLAARESKYFFYSSVWGAAFSVIGNFLLIPRLGIMGAAIAVLLSFIAMAVSRIVYGWKYVRIQNIPLYIGMLLIALTTIVLMLYVQTGWKKYCLLAVLVCLFVCINYGLKKDVLKLYQGAKHKLLNRDDL